MPTGIQEAREVNPLLAPNVETTFSRTNTTVGRTVVIERVYGAGEINPGTYQQTITFNTEDEVMSVSAWVRLP